MMTDFAEPFIRKFANELDVRLIGGAGSSSSTTIWPSSTQALNLCKVSLLLYSLIPESRR